jgi:EAL domain-containing protein (putative c-di-GMP-specific phosphodiesterase class I)
MVAANLGVAMFPEDGRDGETLMLNAESALRQAQASGELMMFYEPRMNASAAESLRLESRLRRALDNGEFVLHYQPKVDFGQRLVQQVEALMRWHDPESGMVSPATFIPILEEMGLIERVGAWALQQAVADILRWRSIGREAPRVAVNVSAVQLRSGRFLNDVGDAMAGFGAAPPLLDIEVTESMLMADVAQANRTLQIIRSMHINIAVDDFGTGYSSLAYLARLPHNALKIDRSFIMAMEEDGAGRTIVESTINLAHSLSLQVIAEGVETQAQADILKDLGCDLMQGYLFSRPLPFEEISQLLPAAATR